MFVPLGSLVSEMLTRRGLQGRILHAHTLVQFRALVDTVWGPQAHSCMGPCRIERDVLLVQVRQAAFAAELQQQEHYVLTRLNKDRAHPLRALRVLVSA